MGAVDGWSDGSIGLARSGIVVTCCKACEILSNVFLVVSPASRLIVVVEDGLIKMNIMSKAACFKKLSVFTSGNRTTLGMYGTISTSRHALLRGK